MKPGPHPFWRLLSYVRSHWLVMAQATLFTFIYQILDMFPEILLGIAVDIVVNKQQSFLASLGIHETMTQLGILGILSVLIWSLESLFEYLQSLLWRNVAQTIQHEIRLDAYNHMQQLQMSYFEDKSTGELISILNDDVNQLERFLNTGINDIITNITSPIVTIIILFYLAPSIAVITMVPIPFILMISFRFQKNLAALYQKVREHAGLLGARLADNIAGIATIKSYTTENLESHRLTEYSSAYQHANKKTIAVSAAFIPVVRVVVAIGFICPIVLGGWYALQGYLAIGAYSSIVGLLTQRILWPFTELAKNVDLYERAMASTHRILDLLQTPIAIQSGSQEFDHITLKGNIVFDRISFVYPNGTSIFDNFSLAIPAGSSAAFIGATGSGKTTIIKLLLRFYDPTGGSIFLDGMNIQNLRLQSLRRAIGFVSQDIFLFHGTIYENIIYGSPQATFNELMHAAKTANAHDFIVQLPHGYHTIIGEGGVKLSGGQRQRISIARALLKNPPILIIDGATSSTEHEKESTLQQLLQHISQGRTTIIIAHHLSAITHADTIFVLDKGNIIAHGSYQDIVHKKYTLPGTLKSPSSHTSTTQDVT